VSGQSLAIAWGYDVASRLETYTDASGGVTRYGYDLADRRVQRTDPTERVHSWGLDPNGNATSWTDALGTPFPA
jgi:YD repeat-containing protein